MQSEMRSLATAVLLVMLITLDVCADPGSASVAQGELKFAKENLQRLSMPTNYEDVYKKVYDLSRMEPKDWKEKNLEEALQSFMDGLNKRLQAARPQDEVEAPINLENEDFIEASYFVLNLCRAFSHIGGCDMFDIEGRIKYLRKLTDGYQKLEGLVTVIKLQIENIQDRH